MERATIAPAADTPETDLSATQAGSAEHRAGMKFIFANGSRPLAGYTIKRGVGRGGFGEVYYAVSDAGKEVALKLIRRHLDVELRGINHCLNLKHPNLLALYDVKQDDEDNTWVVMEYMTGQSLAEVLEQHPQGLPPAEVCDWLRGVAAGAAYLHSHGIVHRDLKPGNIFRDEGLVKLGDYGLSKFISCSRRSGQTDSVGTVHYMAPEVANGRYGKQIDIYALGVILYESLTGRVPFEGESVGEVLMKHLTALPDLSALQEPYRSVAARALAKDPDKRFASVEELIAALPAGQGTSHVNFAAAPTPPRPAEPRLVSAAVAGGAAATGAAATQAIADSEEPIWRGVREQWAHLAAWWNSPGLGTTGRIFVGLAGIFLLLSKAALVVPAAVTLLIAYGAYRLVREIVLGLNPHLTSSPTISSSPAQQPAAYTAPTGAPGPTPARDRLPVAPVLPARQLRKHWREKAVPALVIKPARERLAELLGSLLMSAGATLVISGLMLLLRRQPSQPEQYAWLAVVSTLGVWSVLVPAKAWEGTRGDATLRRFAMLVVGLAIGAVAFGFDRLLMVDLPVDGAFTNRMSLHGPDFGHSLYASDGTPLVGAFLAYFGMLFLCVRWWRQADPLRTTRLSLWVTARSIFVAWLITLIWPFPQPWGLMMAATISLSVQLASPWTGPHRAQRD